MVHEDLVDLVRLNELFYGTNAQNEDMFGFMYSTRRFSLYLAPSTTSLAIHDLEGV